MNVIQNPCTLSATAVAATLAANSGLGSQLISAANSQQILSGMTLREKIGQKIMLDFRYWGINETTGAAQDMVVLNDSIEGIIREHHIGGIILFSNNMKSGEQISALTAQLNAITGKHGIGLFIATDNEGGNVFRLPRSEYTAFSGNMALGALYEGCGKSELAYLQGLIMAQELLALGINTNFAPVVDVNSNQSNPVINVRAFSDAPQRVDLLAREMVKGGRQVVNSYKHFPGHGDTHTDSHLDLPRVNRSREEAYAIDLVPFSAAIADGEAPDMIMTAHIQYPALDNSRVARRDGEEIVVPATMSRVIQHDLLRNKLGFGGVTITDALDMKAISNHFDPGQVIKQVFNAGIDIALMPVSIHNDGEAHKLCELIDYVAAQVEKGEISAGEIDDSVARILALKQAKNVVAGAPVRGRTGMDEEQRRLAKEVEQAVADKSITLLQNNRLLPLRDTAQKIFIITPWSEQGNAVKQVFREAGFNAVSNHKLSQTSWQDQKRRIDRCDVLIIGSQSVNVSPVENNGQATGAPAEGASETAQIAAAIDYARHKQKKIILLVMRSPYDVIHFDGKTDAVLATYSYYGLENGVRRGESLFSAARTMVGQLRPSGKLPVNIYNIDPQGNTTNIRYPRGFGLSC